MLAGAFHASCVRERPARPPGSSSCRDHPRALLSRSTCRCWGQGSTDADVDRRRPWPAVPVAFEAVDRLQDRFTGELARQGKQEICSQRTVVGFRPQSSCWTCDVIVGCPPGGGGGAAAELEASKGTAARIKKSAAIERCRAAAQKRSSPWRILQPDAPRGDLDRPPSFLLARLSAVGDARRRQFGARMLGAATVAQSGAIGARACTPPPPHGVEQTTCAGSHT